MDRTYTYVGAAKAKKNFKNVVECKPVCVPCVVVVVGFFFLI